MPRNNKIDPEMKKYVRSLIESTLWNIGHSEYVIDIEYLKEDKAAPDRPEWNIAAECTVNRRYLRATVRIYPLGQSYWNDGQKQSFREVVVHELAHIATEHMKDLVWSPFKDDGECRDAWESLTTRVADMSMRMADLRDKKK